jgi:PilZ domain
MSFGFSSPQVIRSAKQRALAEHWDRLASGRLFPELTELRGIDDIHDPRQLVVWNVEGQGRLRKFRALYQGEHVAAVFNSEWTGKTMEAVVPMSLRAVSLDAAKESAASGCLLYTILSTFDSSDQRVECERLLLPFGRGTKVEQLLMSLHLTEARSRLRVVKHFAMHTDTILEVKMRSSPPTQQAQSASSRVSGSKPIPKPNEMRRARRRSVWRAARISFARRRMTCIVCNLSATGAAIAAPSLQAIPDNFRLVMEMESVEHQCRVVWRKKGRIGVTFA